MIPSEIPSTIATSKPANVSWIVGFNASLIESTTICT